METSAEDPPHGPTLGWVGGVLRGESSDTEPEGSQDSLLEQFLPFPSNAQPRLLIPRGFRRGAGRSVLEFTDATRLRVRLERAALSVAIRTGVLQTLLDRSPDGFRGGRRSVHTPLALEEHVRDVFGCRDARFAVHLGPMRANIKPVLRVFDDEGRTLGYVKIGWNSLTKDLVRHEADVLKRFQHQSLLNFRVPALIHSGAWRDLELLAVSPAPVARWLGLPCKGLPIAATQEVANLGPTAVEPLETSSYWVGLRKRASEQREASSSSQAQRVLPAVIDYIESRYGHRSLSFGTWHGDWVPWNMRHLDDSLYIWDWERSDDWVPLGLDAVHFEFQVNLWLRRKSPVKALVDSIARSSETLQDIIPEKGLEHLLATLTCVEMSIRMEQGALASVPVPGRTYLALEELFSVLRERTAGSGTHRH